MLEEILYLIRGEGNIVYLHIIYQTAITIERNPFAREAPDKEGSIAARRKSGRPAVLQHAVNIDFGDISPAHIHDLMPLAVIDAGSRNRRLVGSSSLVSIGFIQCPIIM